MKRRMIALTVLTVAAVMGSSIPAYARKAIPVGKVSEQSNSGPGSGEWVKTEDGNWWFQNTDGTWPADEWKWVWGLWYYFDEAGYMMTGWVEDDGKYYWLDTTGAMVSDTTVEIDGVEYHFQEDGACLNPGDRKEEAVGANWPYQLPTVIPEDSEKTELHRTVDAMADSILAGITNDQMNKTEKARAIYSWVRGNLRYVSTSEKGDWVKAAYDGFRKKSGDCYTYYSVALALLNRVDIPSIEVNRLDGHHWWNLINCGEGWYHFDTCPRESGESFCLWTDAQLQAYSNRYVTSRAPYGSHGFDRALYPPTP